MSFFSLTPEAPSPTPSLCHVARTTMDQVMQAHMHSRYVIATFSFIVYHSNVLRRCIYTNALFRIQSAVCTVWL